MQKVEIDKNKPLQPGDLIELHFKTFGGTWLKAGHVAFIEWQLTDRKDFTIMSSSIPDPHTLVLEIRINKTNPALLTAAIIAAIIIACGLIAWLTLTKVYQILESPAGQVGIAGFGVLAIVAAVVIVLSLLQKK